MPYSSPGTAARGTERRRTSRRAIIRSSPARAMEPACPPARANAGACRL